MRVRSTVLSTLVLGLAGTGVNAAIVEHVGLNDPTTEGWVLDSAGTGHVLAPIANDVGSGYDAWTVDDNSASGYALYRHNFSAGELAAMSGQNWIAALRMRQPGNSSAADGDSYIDVHFGTKRFYVYFGTQADGNPTWDIEGASGPPLAAITGLGAGYHLYEIRYDATTTKADFYVDGQLAYDDWAGLAPGTQRVTWGSGSGVGQDSANYNLVTVTLDPIPEPATLSLVAMGAALGLRRRK